MDIRKLQRAIVDGLEDVKAQDILVFNTEHLSPLFERVIMASGTSNRQTKALAASVRDAVRSQGFSVMRTEGEGNGEWIIVDCGAAVAHIMQPEIRRYYHLEEIWGGKSVKMKFGAGSKGLVKAETIDEDDADDEPVVRKRAAAKTPAAKLAPRTAKAEALDRPAPRKAADRRTAAKTTPARKAASAPVVAKKAPARTASAARAPASKAPARNAPTQSAPTRRAVATSAPAKTAAAKRAPAKPAPARKAAPAKKAAPARKTRRA